MWLRSISDRDAAGDRDCDRECPDIDDAGDRLIDEPAQQPVGQRDEREDHQREQTEHRQRTCAHERDMLERCERPR
jgi:hypothetical protein